MSNSPAILIPVVGSEVDTWSKSQLHPAGQRPSKWPDKSPVQQETSMGMVAGSPSQTLSLEVSM